MHFSYPILEGKVCKHASTLLGAFIGLAVVLYAFPSAAQSVDKGKAYYRHNLNQKAKSTFIEVLYDNEASDTERATALYWLGQISFDERRYNTAIEDWKKLVKKFPDSQKAKRIKQRLSQLREILSKSEDRNFSSAIASNWLSNGDFSYERASIPRHAFRPTPASNDTRAFRVVRCDGSGGAGCQSH